MIYLIKQVSSSDFPDELMAMHELRYRVFKERLNWDVQTAGNMEADDFDLCDPTYLLHRDFQGRINGCVRLLPTDGPNMLRDVFPSLLGASAAPCSPAIWESSRFAMDVTSSDDDRKLMRTSRQLIGRVTSELFAGMIEFGLTKRLASLVTVTDVRMERILRYAGWPLRRIAEPQSIGSTSAVAGYLDITVSALDTVRRVGGIKGPVLWSSLLMSLGDPGLATVGVGEPLLT